MKNITLTMKNHFENVLSLGNMFFSVLINTKLHKVYEVRRPKLEDRSKKVHKHKAYKDGG